MTNPLNLNEWASAATVRRQFRGIPISRSRLMPEWDEDTERAWRDRSAVPHILTSHVLDEPCKMGKIHHGGCWYNPPQYDEFLDALQAARLEALMKRSS